jgi:hypothetical protein
MVVTTAYSRNGHVVKSTRAMFVLVKRRSTSMRLHGAISQKAIIFDVNVGHKEIGHVDAGWVMNLQVP